MGQISWVWSFPRTKWEIFGGTKIYLIWIWSLIFESCATLWFFGTKYLNLAPIFWFLGPKSRNHVFLRWIEGGQGGLETSGRFRHRCREKVFRTPLDISQLTKESSTPSVTDTSHGLHMSESQNDSDTSPHSNGQWYTTYDMLERKTCVKNKIIKNGESKHPDIARTPPLLKSSRERHKQQCYRYDTYSDNKAHKQLRPGETTWIHEQTHGLRKGRMKIICCQRACR